MVLRTLEVFFIIVEWITVAHFRERESFERGEGIDEMMYAIDRCIYTVEVKMYDVRIAQI